MPISNEKRTKPNMAMATAKSISATLVLVLRFWPRELQNEKGKQEVWDINLQNFEDCIWSASRTLIIKKRASETFTNVPKITKSPPKAVEKFRGEISGCNYTRLKSIGEYAEVKNIRVRNIFRINESTRSIHFCYNSADSQTRRGFWAVLTTVKIIGIQFMCLSLKLSTPAIIRLLEREQVPEGSNYLVTSH